MRGLHALFVEHLWKSKILVVLCVRNKKWNFQINYVKYNEVTP